MTLKEVMKELESLGTAQNRKVYATHGVGKNMFGVSYANLYALQKKIRTDHQLALQLWETGNHDACILATLIADPKQVTDSQAEAWVKSVDNYVQNEMLTKLLARTPVARKKAEKWSKSKDEWTGSAGWTLIALLALNDKELIDDFFEPYLEIIGKDIHNRKNRVRHEMNGALIAIGMRNSHLEKIALDVAKKIGKVEVDHGRTGCKTPDAAEYIKRALYRHKKKTSAKA